MQGPVLFDIYNFIQQKKTNRVFWIRENIISGIKLKNYTMGFTLNIERNFTILIMKIILHCGILTAWAFHWHDEIRRQYGLVQAETFIQDFVERLPTLLSFYQGFMKCSFWDSVWNYKDKNIRNLACDSIFGTANKVENCNQFCCSFRW